MNICLLLVKKITEKIYMLTQILFRKFIKQQSLKQAELKFK